LNGLGNSDFEMLRLKICVSTCPMTGAASCKYLGLILSDLVDLYISRRVLK